MTKHVASTVHRWIAKDRVHDGLAAARPAALVTISPDYRWALLCKLVASVLRDRLCRAMMLAPPPPGSVPSQTPSGGSIRSGLSLLLLLLAVGCAERAWIRSAPPGAKVYVNERFVGITPVVYSVHRPEFNYPLRYRLELDGYQPTQGELQKRIGPPRIVGACFTLGLSLLFKPPTTLSDRYDIPLQLLPREASAPAPPVAATPRTPTPAETPTNGSVRARLRDLQDLYDRGVITEQEFKRTRERILRDL